MIEKEQIVLLAGRPWLLAAGRPAVFHVRHFHGWKASHGEAAIAATVNARI